MWPSSAVDTHTRERSGGARRKGRVTARKPMYINIGEYINEVKLEGQRIEQNIRMYAFEESIVAAEVYT